MHGHIPLLSSSATMARSLAITFVIAQLLVTSQPHFRVCSFVPSATRASRESRATVVGLAVSVLRDLDVQAQSGSGLTELQFQASTDYATEPLKNIEQTSKSLQAFFFDERIRNKILAGSDNHVEKLASPSRSLFRNWQEETTRNGFVPPSTKDPILKVTSTGISFPGLALRLVATVGCKKVVRNDTCGLQITLLCNELKAEGPKPLVWVFNELTGAEKKPDQRKPHANLFPGRPDSRFTTHSTNTVTAELNAKDGVVFRSAAKLVIDVSFPSIFLNILPVSKETAERQGSEAILKVVSRDIGPCLDELRREYSELMSIHAVNNNEGA